jgi:hypothetical protein
MVENLWFGGTEVCSELSTTTAMAIYKDCNDEPSQARNRKSERRGGTLHQQDDSGGKHNKQQQQQRKHQQKKGAVEDVKMAGSKTFELAGALQVGPRNSTTNSSYTRNTSLWRTVKKHVEISSCLGLTKSSAEGLQYSVAVPQRSIRHKNGHIEIVSLESMHVEMK